MFNRSIIEAALPKPVVAAPVAHYTAIGTLPELLKAVDPRLKLQPGWSSVWATPVQFLNDRRELTLGLEKLQEVARRPSRQRNILKIRILIDDLLRNLGSPATDAFQTSFSGDVDELGQWRGYAANGMGCCVVTDALAVHGVADVAGWVVYDDGEQAAFAARVVRGLRSFRDDLNIQQALVAAASFIKHNGFQPEQEFRLVKFAGSTIPQFRRSGERLVPYLDVLAQTRILPVSEVVIGPGWQLAGLQYADFARHPVVLGVRRLLAARGLHTTDVRSSRIPYDPR